MSTFEGKLLEKSLDFIRIDEFQTRNHDGTLFFLSHFHTDHFNGLFGEEFLKELVENDEKKLYCSKLTKILILNKNKCKIPENKICVLDEKDPHLLYHQDQEPVQITTIPAGHCPGSVMFLFEQGLIRVLYTGDFRINPSDLEKITPLHDNTGTVKTIKTLYLDTTFCDPKFLSFPSRDQTLEDLMNLVTDWLDRDPKNEVGIWYNSYHGLEPFLIELYRKLKILVWVIDTESYNNYACIPELYDSLSKSKGKTRIHLCSVKSQPTCITCGRNRAVTRRIKPCAQSFHQQQLECSGRQKEGNNNLVRIAYSMHCSLEELIGAVKYLAPGAIYPCALPTGVTAQQVLENLKLDVEKLKQENKENRPSSSPDLDSPPHKRFCLAQGTESEETVPDDYNCSEVQEEECKIETVVISSGDEEGEEKPLSQSSLFGLDSPPY